MVHQASSLGSIDLEWSNLFQSLHKMALLDPFLDPKIDFLEPQNIFFWLLKCFKCFSGHISHDIDQKNGPSNEFPSLKRPQMAKLT